jgi:hypothetical protein
MRESDDPILRDYHEYIAGALRTDGHPSIGRRGFALYYVRGGYDCERIKACCFAAGLPVIDSRIVAFEDVVRLAVRGPMPTVGEDRSPPSHHALCCALLAILANAYRAAGAEVFNIGGLVTTAAPGK